MKRIVTLDGKVYFYSFFQAKRDICFGYDPLRMTNDRYGPYTYFLIADDNLLEGL